MSHTASKASKLFQVRITVTVSPSLKSEEEDTGKNMKLTCISIHRERQWRFENENPAQSFVVVTKTLSAFMVFLQMRAIFLLFVPLVRLY